MPLKINYLEGNGIEVLATGVVNGYEIIKAYQSILETKHSQSLLYKILDKSSCTEFAVTSDDIQTMAKLSRQIAKVNPGIIIAIVESKTLQFSLTKLWQAHIKKDNIPSHSFYMRNEALRWIEDHIKLTV